ncbi:Oidioi.mRNA.OKI2018_I69.chr1.g1652.t1.cds [Oikopleura dioica]|uniref:Oidioi.mRNA.OKI2018_I69.chr1.g1652.t1.cds n=1 Tax=Oikopleura dioica TaxID=34765 RepID=A0ABN7SQ85_OIKDI|nr:Oidioi.mRNA.OKI2018_I69.chr1.g1652.t1.cds [Oikopleura dioica]
MTTARPKKVPQEHKSSSRLNQNENARVHKKLEIKQLALQTAVAQILRADRNSWAKVAVGALVIVKDSRRRGYFLSLYSLLQHDSKPLWEEEIYDDMNIQMTRNFFLQFSGRDCQMGINFADESEAQVALEIIKEKAAKFKARKATGLVVKTINEPPHVSSNMGNSSSYFSQSVSSGQLHHGSQQSLDSGIDTSTSNMRGKKKGKLTKLDISGPVENSFKHLNGVNIGPDGRMKKIGNDQEEVVRLLREMNFANERDINEMMKNDQQRKQIYQFIDEKGGLESVQRKHRAQSVKQPAPQVEIVNRKFDFASCTALKQVPSGFSARPAPPIEAHRNINSNFPNYPSNQLKSPPQLPPHVDHKPALPVRRESIHRPQQKGFPKPPPQVQPHGSPSGSRATHGKKPPPPPNARRPPGPPPINSKPPPTFTPPAPPSNFGGPPPPPPPSGGPPPPPAPPAAGGGPPPPPPSSMKPTGGGGPPPPPPQNNKPPADEGRNALLQSIQGMSVNKLRPVSSEVTKDPSPRASVSEPSIVDQLAERLKMMRPAVGGSDDEDDSDNDSEWDD